MPHLSIIPINLTDEPKMNTNEKTCTMLAILLVVTCIYMKNDPIIET